MRRREDNFARPGCTTKHWWAARVSRAMLRSFFFFRLLVSPAGKFRFAAFFAALACFSGKLAAIAAETAPAAPAIADAALVQPAPVLEQPLPPAITQEVPEPQPSAQHVWIQGHWRWQDGGHVWIAPHWELPPIPNAKWVEPRWEKKSNGYVLVEGYWEPPAGMPAVATAPPVPPSTTTVVVTEPPPPPVREIVVERPSVAHVWVSGYWAWQSGRHVWVPGHWEKPPRPRAVWIPPRWEHRGNGYVIIEGYWSDVTEMAPPLDAPREQIIVRRPGRDVIVLREAPPPPRHEVKGPPPSPRHVWIAGYWTVRDGRSYWTPGRWEMPPRGHSVWVAPRWERQAGGYVLIEGYWR